VRAGNNYGRARRCSSREKVEHALVPWM
jgi:hypothetical protein